MKGMHVRAAVTIAFIGVALVVGLWLQPATAYSERSPEAGTQLVRTQADRRYLQNTHVFVSDQFSLGSLADATITRLCPSGAQALGGGVDFDAANADVQVISSAPVVGGTNLFAANEGKNPAGRGWRVTMHNNGVPTVTGVMGVICSR